MFSNASHQLRRSADCYRILSKQFVESHHKVSNGNLIYLPRNNTCKIDNNFGGDFRWKNIVQLKEDAIVDEASQNTTVCKDWINVESDSLSAVTNVFYDFQDDISHLTDGTICDLDEAILDYDDDNLTDVICGILRVKTIPDESLKEILRLITDKSYEAVGYDDSREDNNHNSIISYLL